jgi:hypothetical protein
MIADSTGFKCRYFYTIQSHKMKITQKCKPAGCKKYCSKKQEALEE